jgi:Zn-dependent protease with chaperone function
MSTEIIHFPGISSRAWEHPADTAALRTLRRVPGFDLALRKMFGLFSERALRMITLGSAVEVGADQFAHINSIYEDVLQTLDAPERYQLFISQNPIVNAGAVGMDHPFIVLNSGTVSLMDDIQLRSVLGHELGHILSDHVLYKTMLRLLLRAGIYAFSLPLTGFALLAVLSALMEWDRKSELSADRAGLLVVQDPDVSRSALLRMAGGGAEGASVAAFQEQARRYDETTHPLDSVVKTMALLGRRHPFPVQRIRELDAWIDAGEYQQIIDGNYPLRVDDPEEHPMGDWFREMGSTVEDTANTAWDWIRSRVTVTGGETGEE